MGPIVPEYTFGPRMKQGAADVLALDCTHAFFDRFHIAAAFRPEAPRQLFLHFFGRGLLCNRKVHPSLSDKFVQGLLQLLWVQSVGWLPENSWYS